MDIEIWKEFETGFSGMGLLVSDHGRVKNREWRDRKTSDNGNGYKKCTYTHQVAGVQKLKNYYVHRLVALTFVHNPDPKTLTQVNHKDGDKENNHHSNLEWVSPSQNIRHSHEEGLSLGRRQHGETRNVDPDVVISAYYKVKHLGFGVGVTAKEYNIPRTTLSSIINKRCHVGKTDMVDDICMVFERKLSVKLMLDLVRKP